LTFAVQPARVLIERSATAQLVNFDFVVTNPTPEPLTIDEIEVSVKDAAGALQLRKFLSGNGTRPSIDLLGARTLEPGARLLVFNPLWSFDPALELTTLAYEIRYSGKDDKEARIARVDVEPVDYAGPTLQLPVAGRLLVWDGHDFASHHRRFDYLLPGILPFGFRTNVARYSYDLVPIADDGSMHRGAADKDASWLGFGAPVLAAGAGKVVAVRDDRADDHQMDMQKLAGDHLELYGNHVVIEQAPGEFALYAHLRQRSARCKVGDTVKAGQPIAAIGTSGSALFPHLHFQLQTTADADGEGLPSYFGAFKRRLGARSVGVERGQIDSGDIIEAVER
jgi:murein DD-endopeptidase MepM/ murein hydrolase activator NlpD